MTGAEFRAYLLLLCHLQPGERVLDIGCGCGLMALFLADELGAAGAYTGVDIHRPSIAWCRRHFAGDSRFTFTHIDVANQQFNPRGETRAEAYRFPFPDRSFDVILCKSLFTHMRPAEVENYLAEIARLLAAGGRCLATFFLFDAPSVASNPADRRLQFRFGEGVWRYEYAVSPESAVAYSQDYVVTQLERVGLAIEGGIHPGRWSGAPNALSFQDIMVLVRG